MTSNMNATQEVREQYKQAARTYIEHINTKDLPMSKNFYEGRLSGLDVALSCLGVTSNEIREMYAECEEQVKDERANEDIGPGDVSYDEEGFVIEVNPKRLQPEIEQQAEQAFTEQEELDAIERPVSPKEWTAYCDKCGKPFNPKDAVKIPYYEYPGASVSYEDASPCCGTEFSDRPKEDVEREELDAIERPVSQAHVEQEASE